MRVAKGLRPGLPSIQRQDMVQLRELKHAHQLHKKLFAYPSVYLVGRKWTQRNKENLGD